MLTPHLDGKKDLPLYEQLYQYIKGEIEGGRLAEGRKLPSKRRLSNHLSIGINTVSAAYNQLVDEGYLRSEERRGFFVEVPEHRFLSTKDKPLPSEEMEEERKIRYDFSFNTVDEEAFPYGLWSKCAKEVFHREDGKFLNGLDPRGIYPLRLRIAEYLRDTRGLITSPDRIIISSGTEILFHLLFALLPEQAKFFVEDPGYERLGMMFQTERRCYEPVGLDRDGLLVEELEKRKGDIVCVTPSHQFPTGVIMPLSRRLALLDWASKEEGRYIVEDDYDSEFRYSGKPIAPLKSMDGDDRVVYMGSFSKSLFPGLRLSYMIPPQELLDQFVSQLGFFQCPVSVPEQWILEEFMGRGHFEKHLHRMRKRYKKKREVLVKCCEEYFPESAISGDEAGLHFLLHLNTTVKESVVVEGLKRKGIFVRGLDEYRVETGRGEPVLVLGYGSLPEEKIREGTKALMETIRELEEDETK